jgi:hypothetical protein
MPTNGSRIGVPDAAERWYAGLMAALSSLRQNPRRCARVFASEFQGSEIRMLAGILGAVAARLDLGRPLSRASISGYPHGRSPAITDPVLCPNNCSTEKEDRHPFNRWIEGPSPGSEQPQHYRERPSPVQFAVQIKRAVDITIIN